jgi:hypothetical protein
MVEMTTSTDKVGIKSLSARITDLEQAVTSGTPIKSAGNFADQLISVNTTTLKDDLNTVLQHYEQGLTALGIDISNFSIIDLVKAIPYTITYVETNASVIAGLLKKDVTSAFKLNTAVTFLKQYISQQEALIVAWVEHEVDVLLNNGKQTLNNILPNTKSSAIATSPASVSKASSKRLFCAFKSKSK